MKPEQGHSRVAYPARVRDMLGDSLHDQKRKIQVFARQDGIMVITGEEGVGKALLAAHIHAGGPNSVRELLSINITTSGDRHQRLSLLGADFTHLTSSKRSLLEHPTTVVIKHVDHAYPSVQETLARSLAAGSFSRPGSIRTKPVRCRPIFTFRKSLDELLKDASLAESLHKLLVVAPSIHIPPLRERTGDLLSIARAFYGRPLPVYLEQALLEHGWPGNVAELRAAIECLKPPRWDRGLPDRCRREFSQMLLRIEEGSEFSLRDSLSIIERGIIYHALKKTDGHRARAAQLLGLTDTALRWHIDRIRKSS